jgi:hypothetical protein
MNTFRQSAPAPRRGTAALTGLARGAFCGFVLGILLSLLAGSWVWLEMRVNLGLLIPGMTLVCLAVAARWENLFSHRFFIFLQLLVIAAFIAIYGFDPVALRVVPASFFRQGIQAPGMSLDAANVALVMILTAGNAFMFMKAHLVPIQDSPRRPRQG